jgi:hypothetical protein|nr:MAG TPA: hypothetical protein [Caudoviricetes sp.]
MTLLELLRQELPKRGGWPEGAVKIHQDYDGETWAWLNHDSVEPLFTLGQVATNARKFGEYEKCENMVTRAQYESALATSQNPAWNGDGLPPVGVECEYSWAGEPWASGVIRYISKHTIIVEIQADSTGDTECAYHPTDIKFRPLRTEAERAIFLTSALSQVAQHD